MNAAEFLHLLYDPVPDGWLETTFLGPKEVKLYPRTVVLWKSLPLGVIDPKMPRLIDYNRRGYGVYFGLAVRKERKYPETRTRKDTGEIYRCEYPRGWQIDSKYLTSLFVDVDAKDYDGDKHAALAAVRKINPSVIVDSGGGWHGYLLLDDPLLITDDNRGEVKRTLKGLAKFVGADPHVAELARIFRMPETINTKPGRNGAKCSVFEALGHRYHYRDLRAEYALPAPPVRPIRDNLTVDKTEVAQALNFIPPKDLGYDDWIGILAGLTHSLGALEAERLADNWTGWCSQPGEISSKIASFDGDTGSQTASLGKVFYLAGQYGYKRTPKATDQVGMSLENKRACGQHINQLGRLL